MTNLNAETIDKENAQYGLPAQPGRKNLFFTLMKG